MSDSYIPPGNFFTPKRPSFRMTPGPPNPQNGSRFNMNMHHNRRVCYQQPMTPPFIEDRRMHGNMYQNQRYFNGFFDRFGRYQDSTHYNGYGPQRCGPQAYNRGHFGFGQGFNGAPPAHQQRYKRWQRRDEGEVKNQQSGSPSKGGQDKGNEVRKDDQKRDGQGTSQERQVERGTQEPEYYNYDSPEVMRSKKERQHVQPIQYNDELPPPPQPPQWPMRKDPTPEDEIMKVVLHPHTFEAQRIFENQMYMDHPPPPPHHSDPPPPYEAVAQNHSYVQVPWPPQLDQLQILQSINPSLLYPTNTGVYNGGNCNLIQAAQIGFDQFKQDYSAEVSKIEVDGVVEDEEAKVFKLAGGEVNRSMGVDEVGGEFKYVRFDVDTRDFVDNREVVRFVKDGDKEYKLFEDREDRTKIAKGIYNVSCLDYFDSREMLGYRMQPIYVKKWPIDFIGMDFEDVRKMVLQFAVAFDRVDGERVVERVLGDCGEGGAYGLKALGHHIASADWNPDGGVTRIGMNVHKLVKDLDTDKFLCSGFGGPLADRNFILDAGGCEVTRGFEEYSLFGERGYAWTVKHRLTRNMFKLFGLEVLFFLFYTMAGDALQLLAASEIYLRGWRYHKIYQVWVTPWGEGGRLEDGNLGGDWEGKEFKYFDFGKWGVERVSMVIRDGVLEERTGVVFDALWD